MSTDALSRPIQSFVEVSYEIFATIPRDVADSDVTNEFKMCVHQSSGLFRNALRTLNEEISSVAESSSTNDTAAQFDAEFDMIYTMEQVWHICEIVLLNPSNQVFVETAKWLKVCPV